MDIQDIAREHVFAKTLAERDEMILALHKELMESREKLANLEKQDCTPPPAE